MDRGSLRFGRLRPQVVSMYDRSFWFHERHWKYCGTLLSPASTSFVLFKGTPMKNILSRLVGVRIGKRVFDDGCLLFDKTLLEIGDYANLNEACAFRAHSLEEGVFKADHVRIGSHCTVGSRALVHYGVNIADNVVIEPDAFVMKGETLDAGTVWRGNPARLIGRTQTKLAVVEPVRFAQQSLSAGGGLCPPAMDQTRRPGAELQPLSSWTRRGPQGTMAYRAHLVGSVATGVAGWSGRIRRQGVHVLVRRLQTVGPKLLTVRECAGLSASCTKRLTICRY